jgi:hypothetical protein
LRVLRAGESVTTALCTGVCQSIPACETRRREQASWRAQSVGFRLKRKRELD